MRIRLSLTLNVDRAPRESGYRESDVYSMTEREQEWPNETARSRIGFQQNGAAA